MELLATRAGWPIELVRLGPETRPASVIQAGEELQAELGVVASSVLEFGLAATSEAICDLRLIVSVRRGGEALRRVAEFHASDLPGEVWTPVSIPIEAHSGGTAQLEWAAVPKGPPCGRFLVASPVLYEAGRQDPRPDIFLISIDTLRADRLGSYGYRRDTSPTLDRLAAEGVRFRDVTSHSPWTTPSHMSLFTSLYPSEHGVNHRIDIDGNVLSARGASGLRALPTDIPVIAQRLRDVGYRTVAFGSGGPIGAGLGFARGFESFREELRQLESKLDHLLESIRRYEGRPTFVFLHTFEVHMPYLRTRFAEPYLAPEAVQAFADVTPIEQKYGAFLQILFSHDLYNAGTASDLYDGGIRYTDDQLGRLLNRLQKRSRQTIVILTSDHGEAFAERDPQAFVGAHGSSMFQEQIRIPLLIHGVSGAAPGKVVDEPVQQVDIAPTLLELAGLEPSPGMRGRSLLPVMRGESKPPPRFAISEATNIGPDQIAVRSGPLKLMMDVSGSRRRLFELDTDPAEVRDRSNDVERSSVLEREALRHFLRARPGYFILSVGRGCYSLRGTIRTSSPIVRVDPLDLMGSGLTLRSPTELELHVDQTSETSRVLAFRCQDAESCGIEIDLMRDGRPLVAADILLRGVEAPHSTSMSTDSLRVSAEEFPLWTRDGATIHLGLVDGVARGLGEPPDLDRADRDALEALGYVASDVSAVPPALGSQPTVGASAAPGKARFVLDVNAAPAGINAWLRSGPSWCRDFDGDGASDRLVVATETWEPVIEWSGREVARWPGDPLLRGKIRSWDVNGDSRADVLVTGDEGRAGCAWYFFGGRRFHRFPCQAGTGLYVYDADFNGDGQDDRLVVDHDRGEYRVTLAGGRPEEIWFRNLPGGVRRPELEKGEGGRTGLRVEASDLSWCHSLVSAGDHFVSTACDSREVSDTR